jgi:hypothetical protein
MRNEWNYIVAAYVAAWVTLLGYAGYVHALARRARAAYDKAGAGAGERGQPT